MGQAKQRGSLEQRKAEAIRRTERGSEIRTPMITVGRDEFAAFIQSYPRPLQSGSSNIVDPPVQHFHDQSLPSKFKCGSPEYFFDTEVASVRMDWMGPDGDIDKGNTGKFWQYRIKKGDTQ